MSERYKKLYSLPHRLYASHAPVLIESGALLLEQQSNAMLCQLCFRNIQDRPIKSLRAQVQLLDSQGEALGAPADHRYQELELKREETCGRDSAIVLPDQDAASFTVTVTQVSFSDGEIWAEDAPWMPLADQLPLNEADEEEQERLRFLRRVAGERPMAPLETEELWFCVCGAVNHSAEGRCRRCRTRKALLFGKGALPTPEELEEASFHAGASDSDPDRSKRLRGLLFGALGVVALAVLVIVLLPRLNRAKAAPDGARKEPVSVAAQSAPGGQETSSPVAPQADPREAAYLEALDLQTKAESAPEGDDDFYALYLSAAEAFEALGDYRDSESRARQCREKLVLRNESALKEDYAAAQALLESGHYSEARAAFLALGDFSDSREQADEALYRRNRALYSYLTEHELRGVTASLSTEPEQESRIALSRAQLLGLGSRGLQELEAVFGGDPLLLITEESAAGTLQPIEQELAEQFETLGDYRDSAALAAELPEMIDRSGEFFALCAAGELERARDWLNAYDKPFEERELWLARIDRYLPYCRSWELFAGDPSLPSQAAGGVEKLYAFRCEVRLTPEGAVLRFVSEEAAGDAPEMGGELDEGRFMTQLGSTGFIAQLNTSGSLTMVKFKDCKTIGGAEYVPQR